MIPAPSAFRVLQVLAAVALRRRINFILRNMSAAFGKKKPAAAAPRKATPRKSKTSVLLLAFLGLMLLFNGVNLSCQFLRNLSNSMPRLDVTDARIAVNRHGWRAIGETSEALRAADAQSPNRTERFKTRKQWMDYLKQSLQYALDREHVPAEEQAGRIDTMLRRFEADGVAGFRLEERRAIAILPGAELWPADERSADRIKVVSLVALLAAISFLLMMMGTANQDLGKVEWSMEWFFTFPVQARTLFLAKVLEYTVSSGLVWFGVVPACFVLLLSAGQGWWALPLGLVVGLHFGLLVAGLYVLAETGLRKHLPPNQLKNLQAVASLLGILIFVGLIAVSASPHMLTPLISFALQAPSLEWTPFATVALICQPGLPWYVGAATLVVSGVLVTCAAVGLSQRFVKDGLIRSSGAYSGVRAKTVATGPALFQPASGGTLFRGIVAKDLRLLSRDRNFLVQTLVIPLIMLGLQAVTSEGAFQQLAGNFTYASIAAYGLGAYVLMFSACGVLSAEGNALWLLYTFPRKLHTMLLQKTLLWCSFATLYAVVMLLVCGLANPALTWRAVPDGLMALAGVFLCGFIAAGIGVLATDPLEVEVQRKMRPEMLYLYMLIAAMYGFAIYNPSLWGKLAQLILSSLLAFALWQKVQDHLPYLLDPTQEPPASISLADGLIAALAFFVLQGIVGLILFAAQAGFSPGATILIAFVVAGFLVATFTLYTFWRQKVPQLLVLVGLRADAAQRASYGRAILLGLLGGAVAASFGRLYLWSIDFIEPLRLLKEQALRVSGGIDLGWWLPGLAVFAAPLFEEYIFRGLVFRGLRRSVTPALAVLASAAIFAIVHPPLSVIPVFGLGVAAALCFEKSHLLITPILVHMIYNLAVLVN